MKPVYLHSNHSNHLSVQRTILQYWFLKLSSEEEYYDDPEINGHHYYDDDHHTEEEFEEVDEFDDEEYYAVMGMLRKLKMEHMIDVFMENAVRVSFKGLSK